MLQQLNTVFFLFKNGYQAIVVVFRSALHRLLAEDEAVEMGFLWIMSGSVSAAGALAGLQGIFWCQHPFSLIPQLFSLYDTHRSPQTRTNTINNYIPQ